MKKLQNFTEETYQTTKPTVDRDAGVIRGVKILGRVSRNGREYSETALREAAAIYEGLGVNTNHPNRATPNISRTVEEGIGWLENVTVKPDGVYGDFNVIKSHHMANSLFEVAERKPDRFGLSHNASGDVVERGGKPLVESIKSVRSVDLVQNPATVNSLFESEDPVTTKTTPFKKLIESLQPKSKDRKFFAALLENDELPMVTPDMPVEVPSAGPTPTADEAARAAFKSAIDALLDDESITWEETRKRVVEMIKTLEKMSGGDPGTPETPAEPPEGEGDETVTESLEVRFNKLQQELLEERATNAARTLLESSKVKVTPARVAAIKRTPNKNEQKELLEDWLKADGPAPKPGVQRPAISKPAPLLESQDSPGHKPAKGADAMLAAYR